MHTSIHPNEIIMHPHNPFRSRHPMSSAHDMIQCYINQSGNQLSLHLSPSANSIKDRYQKQLQSHTAVRCHKYKHIHTQHTRICVCTYIHIYTVYIRMHILVDSNHPVERAHTEKSMAQLTWHRSKATQSSRYSHTQ